MIKKYIEGNLIRIIAQNIGIAKSTIRDIIEKYNIGGKSSE